MDCCETYDSWTDPVWDNYAFDGNSNLNDQTRKDLLGQSRTAEAQQHKTMHMAHCRFVVNFGKKNANAPDARVGAQMTTTDWDQ